MLVSTAQRRVVRDRYRPLTTWNRGYERLAFDANAWTGQLGRAEPDDSRHRLVCRLRDLRLIGIQDEYVVAGKVPAEGALGGGVFGEIAVGVKVILRDIRDHRDLRPDLPLVHALELPARQLEHNRRLRRDR